MPRIEVQLVHLLEVPGRIEEIAQVPEGQAAQLVDHIVGLELEAPGAVFLRLFEGVGAQVLPLTRRGLEGLARFAELECWGPFSNPSLNKSFQRACEKVGPSGKRAYDLRHTFGTEMYRRTHDPLVVQQLMLHRSSETTRRYILGAVPDVLQQAIDAVDETLAAGSIGWQWGSQTPHTAPKVIEKNGAGDGGRTRDLQLGKLTLYH